MNGDTIMHGYLKHGIYILTQFVSIIYTGNKHLKLDNISDTYLWHCHLGHINENRINKLIKEGTSRLMVQNHFPHVSPISLVK